MSGRLKGSKDGIHTLEPDTAQALKRMKETSDGVYVFRSERGGPFRTTLSGRSAGARGSWRVSGAPHMLRHAAGFALAEAGSDTRLIQDFLGHKDIKNTVIYTETSQSRLRAVRVR